MTQRGVGRWKLQSVHLYMVRTIQVVGVLMHTLTIMYTHTHTQPTCAYTHTHEHPHLHHSRIHAKHTRTGHALKLYRFDACPSALVHFVSVYLCELDSPILSPPAVERILVPCITLCHCHDGLIFQSGRSTRGEGQGVKVSGRQGVRVSRRWGVRASGRQGVRVSGCQGIRVSVEAHG